MIGLEPTFDEHLENLVAVFREVRRVLAERTDALAELWGCLCEQQRPSGGGVGRLGTGGSHGSRQRHSAARAWNSSPKTLMMMPARVAMALRDDGARRAGDEDHRTHRV